MGSSELGYHCRQCGGGACELPWAQCPDCGVYGTLTSDLPPSPPTPPFYPLNHPPNDPPLTSVRLIDLAEDIEHHPTGFEVIDTAFGGGLVWGYTALFAGAPGTGKTTLALKLADALPGTILFASGEENSVQVGQAAARLHLRNPEIRFMEAESLPELLAEAERVAPQLLVVNSINTTYDPAVKGSPGSANQIRGVIQRCVKWTQGRSLMTILTGHTTWRGHSVGPRTLEHAAGVVCYLYVEPDGARRLVVKKSRIGTSPQVVRIPALTSP